MTEPSVQGALVQAVASGAAVSGLLLLVWALESRTGTADFRRFGGFGQVMPRMATVFFVFSAAAVGFPGSLMFVGEDLIVHGVLDEHPVVAAVVLISMASNGYMLIRAFSRIFLGPSMDARDALDPSLLGGRSESLHDMLGRERAVAAAFALVIIGGGIHPQPLITLSHDAALALALHHERHEPAEAEDHEGEGHHPEGH
jgi:NADH-quinone oxidoreductase subunit M